MKPAGEMGRPEVSKEIYLPLLSKALARAGGSLVQPGTFCLRRGSFVIAHAVTNPLNMKGEFVDLFQPELPIVREISLKPGQSGLYRDVAMIKGRSKGSRRVLHCTHRLMEERWSKQEGRLVIRGPAETPGVVRLRIDRMKWSTPTGRSHDGKRVDVLSRVEGETALLTFPNDPQGVTLEFRSGA
jgi:hypothetical protein